MPSALAWSSGSYRLHIDTEVDPTDIWNEGFIQHVCALHCISYMMRCRLIALALHQASVQNYATRFLYAQTTKILSMAASESFALHCGIAHSSSHVHHPRPRRYSRAHGAGGSERRCHEHAIRRAGPGYGSSRARRPTASHRSNKRRVQVCCSPVLFHEYHG